MKSRFTGCFLIAALLAGGTGCQTMAPMPPSAEAVSNTPAASQGGAEIRFAETEHDFGEVANGASLKYDFVFTNTGTSTLEVTDVSPECSCATTGDWSRKVEPGRSGTIPIRFNSTTLSGPIHKLVGVTCNSPTRTQTVLHLKAIVWKAIEETKPGHAFNIILDFPAGFTSGSGTPAELSVKTSHPQFPIVRVPIIQAQ